MNVQMKMARGEREGFECHMICSNTRHMSVLRVFACYFFVPISDEFVANLVDVVLHAKTLVHFIEIDQFSI